MSSHPKRAMRIPNPPALFRFRQSIAASSPTWPQYQEYLGTSDCDAHLIIADSVLVYLCTPDRQTSMTNRCKYPTPNVTPTRNSKAPSSSPSNGRITRTPFQFIARARDTVNSWEEQGNQPPFGNRASQFYTYDTSAIGDEAQSCLVQEYLEPMEKAVRLNRSRNSVEKCHFLEKSKRIPAIVNNLE